MKSKIENIVFDIGYVLIDYRWEDMIREYVGTEDEERVQKIYEYMKDDPEGVWTRYDKGLADSDEVVAAFSRKYPDEAESLAWLWGHPEKMHLPRPRVWEKVHQLKEKGYKIYLLSNYPKDLLDVHINDTPFVKDVDGMMVSYMIHASKPEPAIYQALFEKYALKPETCVFFDDRKDNIEAAIALGMEGIQVTSEEKFLEDMEIFLR